MKKSKFQTLSEAVEWASEGKTLLTKTKRLREIKKVVGDSQDYNWSIINLVLPTLLDLRQINAEKLKAEDKIARFDKSLKRLKEVLKQQGL
jgi:hypothetical protein